MINESMHELCTAISEVAKAYANQAVAKNHYTSLDYAFTEVLKAEQKLKRAITELEVRINK